MTRVDGQTKFASFLAVLFGVPFCLAGLAIMSGGLKGPGGAPVPFPMAVIFGLLFLCGGLTVILGISWGIKKSRKQKQIQADNPSSPWLWREDWAEGRANSQMRSKLFLAWFVAFAFAGFSVPALLNAPWHSYQTKPGALFLLIFPAVEIWILVWAARETLAYFEFGKTFFQMTSVPIVIGREMRGAIQARFPKPPEHGIRLKLSCVNRVVTGSGKNQTTQEKIVWRDEHVVGPGELFAGPTGTTIPVTFHVPFDARATDGTDPRNSILWVLEADADVPGVDYKDSFEIPVFRTKDSPAEAEEFEHASVAAPAAATVKVTPTADGTEFYFPAARNKGFGAQTSVFLVVWTGVIYFLVRVHAPFIFPLFFGLFDLLFFYITAQMWFGTSDVVVSRNGIKLRAGLLRGGKVQEIPATDVSGITSQIRSQQGGATGTPYYDILLTTNGGKTVTLGQTLRDKQEAEWLVSEMLRVLGRNPMARAASAR